jgi:hypothetical protein
MSMRGSSRSVSFSSRILKRDKDNDEQNDSTEPSKPEGNK